MRADHPSLQTVADLLSGEIEGDHLRREVIPHLLSACPDCRQRVEEIRGLQNRVDHWNESVVVREGLAAPTLMEELLALPVEDRLERLETDPRLVTWGLCQLLIETCRSEIFDLPVRAAEAAELAVLVGERLGDGAYHPDWVEDLRARAWGHLGNARRVLGELRAAGNAFRRAEHHLRRSGSGRAVVEAEILHLRASHRRAQRRLPEAGELLDRAIRLYRRAGDQHQVGRATLTQAKVLEETGDLGEAVTLLHTVPDLLDPGREPRLELYAHHNLLCCLILDERFAEAESLLPGIRDRFEGLGAETRTVDRVRLRWAEARIALGLEHPEEAAALLEEVQRFFLENELSLDAALVSLDLAVVYARQDRAEDLRLLAARILPLFQAEDLYRETLAALYLFHQAVQKQTVTLELITEVASFVRKGRGG